MTAIPNLARQHATLLYTAKHCLPLSISPLLVLREVALLALSRAVAAQPAAGADRQLDAVGAPAAAAPALFLGCPRQRRGGAGRRLHQAQPLGKLRPQLQPGL